MLKTIKRTIVSSISILSLSFLCYVVFLINPSLSYAHETQFDQVTVFHNQDLDPNTEAVVSAAYKLISTADIFDKNMSIQLCLNEGSFYPELHPAAGGTAYAFLDKTIVYLSTPDFTNNTADFRWAINNYELRKYNLTYLLAHEFMHNLQYNEDSRYQISTTYNSLNWKLEGHADYIARSFKDDGLLQAKIDKLLQEEQLPKLGLPVFKLEDGTIQNFQYFKYALVVQFLMEVKGLDYTELCELDSDFETHYIAMLTWYKGSNEVDR